QLRGVARARRAQLVDALAEGRQYPPRQRDVGWLRPEEAVELSCRRVRGSPRDGGVGESQADIRKPARAVATVRGRERRAFDHKQTPSAAGCDTPLAEENRFGGFLVGQAGHNRIAMGK